MKRQISILAAGACLACVVSVQASPMARPATKLKDLLPLTADVMRAPVSIESELDALFGGMACKLPDKLQNALAASKKQSYLPVELQRLLGDDFKAFAKNYSNSTATATLHRAELKTADGGLYSLELFGSDSYSHTSAMSLIDSQKSNVSYTTDCSGYLNATIAAKASFFMGSTQDAASAAVQSTHSLIVVRGDVFSPVALAMAPDLSALKLPAAVVSDILYDLIAQANNQVKNGADDEVFTAYLKTRMLWTSNQGSSSLSGSATVGGTVSAGIPVASFSGSTAGGASFSRAIVYNQFKTYFLDPDEDLVRVDKSLGEIRRNLMEAISTAKPTSVSHIETHYDVFFKEYPKSVCMRSWSARKDGDLDSAPSAADVVYTWRDGSDNTVPGCLLSVTPVTGVPDGARVRIFAPSTLKPGESFTNTFSLSKV